ncbi:AarF/ABC1/UbiB kinase family protein [Euhalothece natronophila Z-M001]|uniref:AarF/ABC1/UbiB kinase family protein n=1 Tax=Euhalothece natronophila Z-M001 TaxID=522448 RepID=A0A5B8NP36_9CHRO|nr:AarF/ABC1/UbiB kinase family protein [Euhalothece natronophila]QDZ39950.1 AarF/ABC1/UbiB kinase family protein [Euhalothece natronophila Z-M001]
MQKENRPRYDAQAIAQYYRQFPFLILRRLVAIVWILGRFFLHLKLDQWRGLEEQNKYKRARELRELLTKLGPTYIKVGQALSTRPDLVRKDFLDELTKLQDQLPPFDNAIAFNIIEKELERPVKDIYQEISPEPVAAASLGQVYRAVLHSGEEVAVKVQRPNLEPILTLDLYIMRWGISKIKRWLPLNLGHDLTLIIDEFGNKLFEEIDYINEGKNAEQFANNFKNDETVKIPKIYWDYSSYRVLTLEWINGFKLTDTQKIEAANLDQNEITEIGVVAGLRQLLEHGFFHADPHPGNLFVIPDGRMAYIDFGMMDQLEEETKETLATSIVHLLNKDYEKLAENFIFLGFLAPDTEIEPIVPALEQVLGNAMGESVKNFNFKTITDEFSELMYDYPFRIPANFALIIRSLITQEGLALTLDPNFKIVEVAYPYVAQRLLRGESPEMRRRLIEVLFKDGKFQWQRLENMIAIARTNNHNFDLLPTARLGLQYLLSEEGKYLRQQLLLALTENEELQTEQVERLWNLVKEDLKPDKLFDVALSSLREISLEEVAALKPNQ